MGFVTNEGNIERNPLLNQHIRVYFRGRRFQTAANCAKNVSCFSDLASFFDKNIRRSFLVSNYVRRVVLFIRVRNVHKWLALIQTFSAQICTVTTTVSINKIFQHFYINLGVFTQLSTLFNKIKVNNCCLKFFLTFFIFLVALFLCINRSG